MQTIEALAGAALSAAGIALLRQRWLGRHKAKLTLALGWLLVLGGLAMFALAWGAEVGTAYGLVVFSLAAYGVVGAGVELRSAPSRAPREAALEPEERPTSWRRGIAKSLLAIVLAGIAAIGIGVAFAVSMPMPAHDRIVIGGMLVPVLWGGGMAWTLSDARLLRATILLVAISAIGYGIAFLPKVLS